MNNKEKIKDLKEERNTAIFFTILFFAAFLATGFILNSKIDKLNEENKLLKVDDWTVTINCQEKSDNWKINATDVITFPNYEEYKEFLDNSNKLPKECVILQGDEKK